LGLMGHLGQLGTSLQPLAHFQIFKLSNFQIVNSFNPPPLQGFPTT